MSNDNRMWCQNSKCPEKKNQNQIRGTKGHKYYQSNKSASYYFYWCSMNCRDRWWEENKDTCMRAVGLRTEPVKLLMENAWSKDYKWRHTGDGGDIHYLVNKLMGIRIPITEHQYNSIAWGNDECMALANRLRAKQSA